MLNEKQAFYSHLDEQQRIQVDAVLKKMLQTSLQKVPLFQSQFLTIWINQQRDEIAAQAFGEMIHQRLKHQQEREFDVLRDKVREAIKTIYEPDGFELLEFGTLTISSDHDSKELQKLCAAILERKEEFNEFFFPLKETVFDMLLFYLREGRYTNARKIFTNALEYYLEKKVSRCAHNPDQPGVFYQVAGKNDRHTVIYDPVLGGDRSWQCDCSLWSGKLTGQAGHCSHIDAVKLFVQFEFVMY